MKATLEFKLPEEQAEHAHAIDGFKWWAVCSHMDGWLRNKIKYGEGDMTLLEAARRELNDAIDGEGLKLHD